jgi:hypothetical protein
LHDRSLLDWRYAVDLFALSLVAGALASAILVHLELDQAIVRWRQAHPRAYPLIWAALIAVAAAVAICHAPAVKTWALALAAVAVGFEAVRWLAWARTPNTSNVIPYGIGVGAAGLLITALFLFQDAPLSTLISGVKTPVFSVEFTKSDESARAWSLTRELQTTSAPVSSSDPISQGLTALSSSASALRRDLVNVTSFSTTGDIDPRVRKALDREQTLYDRAIVPVARCLLALRAGVRDSNPIVLLDHEMPRALRAAHRAHLAVPNGDGFKAAMAAFLADNGHLARLFEIIRLRRAQHKDVKLVFDDAPDLSQCDQIKFEAAREVIQSLIDQGGFAPESPWFSITVAALLSIMNEQLSSDEEIDAWLTMRAPLDRYLAPARGSTPFLMNRIFRLRAEYWAASFLTAEPKLANLSARRFAHVLETIDDILKNMAPRTIPRLANGMPLLELVRNVDRRTENVLKSDSVCMTMSLDVQRILFSSISTINTVTWIAVVNDLQTFKSDYADIVKNYYEILGYLEPTCVVQQLAPPNQTRALAAFADTYLVAKRIALRQMSEESARRELCKMSDVLGRAQLYADELEKIASKADSAGNYADAEENLETARALRRSTQTFNGAIQKLGPRGCS